MRLKQSVHENEGETAAREEERKFWRVGDMSSSPGTKVKMLSQVAHYFKKMMQPEKRGWKDMMGNLRQPAPAPARTGTALHHEIGAVKIGHMRGDSIKPAYTNSPKDLISPTLLSKDWPNILPLAIMGWPPTQKRLKNRPIV